MRVGVRLRKSIVRFIALSAALHVVVSSLLLIPWQKPKTQSIQEKPIRFFPAEILYAGGSRAPKTDKAEGRKRHVAEPPKPATDLAINGQPTPPAGRPVSAPQSTAAGEGADQQSASSAFPVFSPHPPVKDRSLLPDATRQVIVDVKVSAAGDVMEATLVEGIGNGLDQIVLDTVKTWRFQPATVNGNPVATEAELIFPFNQSYPIAG